MSMMLALSVLAHILVFEVIFDRTGAMQAAGGPSLSSLRVSLVQGPQPSSATTVVATRELAPASAPLPHLGGATKYIEPVPESAYKVAPLIAAAEVTSANELGSSDSNIVKDPLGPTHIKELTSVYRSRSQVDQPPIALTSPPMDELSKYPDSVAPMDFRVFVSAQGQVDKVVVLRAAEPDRQLAEKIAILYKSVAFSAALKEHEGVPAFIDFALDLTNLGVPSDRPDSPN